VAQVQANAVAVTTKLETGSVAKGIDERSLSREALLKDYRLPGELHYSAGQLLVNSFCMGIVRVSLKKVTHSSRLGTALPYKILHRKAKKSCLPEGLC
jgi:hypothetical protein